MASIATTFAACMAMDKQTVLPHRIYVPAIFYYQNTWDTVAHDELDTNEITTGLPGIKGELQYIPGRTANIPLLGQVSLPPLLTGNFTGGIVVGDEIAMGYPTATVSISIAAIMRGDAVQGSFVAIQDITPSANGGFLFAYSLEFDVNSDPPFIQLTDPTDQIIQLTLESPAVVTILSPVAPGRVKPK